jgi:tRNA A-37 threonylcarbamoyl transferase component Bud32
MPSYCCFNCPTSDYSERELVERCPTCSQEYGFPLQNPPTEINGYKIAEPLARGFYSVTYIAAYGKLADPCVLKVSSKKLYEFFGKDFDAECRLHARVARDSEHVVGIRDMFDADVSFGDLVIPCHVAVLNYVDGTPLDKYLEDADNLSSRSIAQIGIDLFRIIGDLESKEIYHNDLHSGNIIIQQLTARRAEAVDGNIKAVVIDLGSVSDKSKSGSQRIGDLHWVARHLRALSQHLLKNSDKASDTEYRLASLLDERAYLLEPQVTSQRRPSVDECISDIREAYGQMLSPWKESLVLRRFDDAYNAQTLDPWFVPMLLVDPDGHWQAAVSTKGPQVLVGMRGCGKTMLLRSLQFHARATAEEEESEEAVLERLRNDGYMGLYVSCTKLLDTQDSPSSELPDPYARLLVAYGLEALRAVRHLQEIDKDLAVGGCYKEIAEGIAHYLQTPTTLSAVGSEFELERRLIEIQIALGSGNKEYRLNGHPVDAFTHLAGAVRKCSPLWNNHYILFLLDDVSTRYLNEPKILELLSQLTFQSPNCAFKLTTEAQTLELGLRSPGQIEKARLGRDYAVFDLGADVYAKVRDRDGKLFVEKILKRRAKYYPNHPKASPAQVLGDASLASIAEKIVTTGENSKYKKEIYHGISALTGMCVGDIGDVIAIYELILKKAKGGTVPVSPGVQSECYQEFFSRRLYDLNRREGKLKDFALSFAQAAHKLLLQSHETRKQGKLKRLRQYNKVYVRITTGDFEEQFKRLRDLIDAGVFILDGGSDTPRTKTRDSNPIQQFALTFRKLFGLGNYIGLAELDRFELSGDQLIEWLKKPAQGAEILMRNLKVETPESEDECESESVAEAASEEPRRKAEQPRLFETEVIGDVFQAARFDEQVGDENYVRSKTPQVKSLDREELKNFKIDTLVLGLGFEDRTLESAKRILSLIKPALALLIDYEEVGHGAQIKEQISHSTENVRVVAYKDIGKEGLEVQGNVFVDITGLAKPALFQSVRSALKQAEKVWICDTRAQIYYPRDEDIQKVIEAERNLDHYNLLVELRKILTGEKGRYDCEKQLVSDADESRRRILCAFSSAKHERLLTLLDERDFDRIEILAPDGKSPRSQLARIAADVAVNNYANTNLTLINSHDLPGVLDFLAKHYQTWYVNGGFNFELALTGSKLQAVACAAMSVAVKVAQCWYVRPLQFDVNRFTIGVGDSAYFEVSLPSEKSITAAPEGTVE